MDGTWREICEQKKTHTIMASETLGEKVHNSRDVRLDGGIKISPKFLLRWNGVIANNLYTYT